MTERAGARPWWSSGPGTTRAEPGPAADEHRTRRPEPDRDPGTHAPDAPHDHDHDHGAHDHEPHDHAGPSIDTCQVCPICALLRVVGETRPEVMVHVLEAARHLTAAAKAMIDAQASNLGGSSGLEHIPLDDD